MALYTVHGIALSVESECFPTGLSKLLEDLSFRRAETPRSSNTLRLTIRLSGHDLRPPSDARQVFTLERLRGFEAGGDYYLTEGSSLLHVEPLAGHARAQLTSGFFEQPWLLQQRFWGFGLMKLLRPLGYFGLHAAGVVDPHRVGVLIVGDSGSGKSTLAIGLVRAGWRYLGDDALLLHSATTDVEALAFRKPFSVDATETENYADLPLGKARDLVGQHKCRVNMCEAYPSQYLPRCTPRWLLFVTIVRKHHSRLKSLSRTDALGNLLTQSGPQLFDRPTAPRHLEVLKQLVSQSASYTLQAGGDLYDDPTTLEDLLAHSGEAAHGTNHH